MQTLQGQGGGLSTLSEKSRRRRTNSGDADIPEESGGGRLEKDYEGDDAADESSDDEDHSYSDEEGSRGRKKEKAKEHDDSHPESHTLGMGRAKGPRTAQSLMAAAEEERTVKLRTDYLHVEANEHTRCGDCRKIQNSISSGTRDHCYSTFRRKA